MARQKSADNVKGDLPLLEFEKGGGVERPERIATMGNGSKKVVLINASTALHVTPYDNAVLDVSKLTDAQLATVQLVAWQEWQVRVQQRERIRQLRQDRHAQPMEAAHDQAN